MTVFAVAQDGLTATAGGGQANGVPLQEGINRVTTVATAADSVKLPAAIDINGVAVIAANHGANSMNVFPNTGDAIGTAAANAAFAVAAGASAMFVCTGPGRWAGIRSA